MVLTGEGADELFLGYNRYRVTHWNARLGRPYWSFAPAAVRQRLRDLVQRLPAPLGRILKRTFLGVDAGIAQPVSRELRGGHANASSVQLLQRPELDGRSSTRARSSRLDAYDGDLLDRMGRLDLDTYLHELLMKQDQMSMAASIESRVPFLDDQLVDHVAGAAVAVQGPRLADQGRCCAPPCSDLRAAGDPVATQDGIPGADRPLAARRLSAAGQRVRARAARRPSGGCSTPRRSRQLAAEHASGAAGTAIACGS